MDPNNDVFGSYRTGPGQKIYNHTCAEYEAGPVGIGLQYLPHMIVHCMKLAR